LNGGCKDQHARLLLEESITLKLWLEHLGLELRPASPPELGGARRFATESASDGPRSPVSQR
jgi:hypothetical protein